MKKCISLLKAIMSQDMELFSFKKKNNSSRLKKMITPIVIGIFFMLAIGTYLGILGVELSKLNLTYIMLTIALILPVILTLIQGIYKSQGILFETKDNDLLFSLPIKKSTIVFARIFKMYAFEYLYNLLFILPAFVIYAYFERPGISFYFISILMSILLPIIPTVIASFIGLLIKNLSVKFRAKKIAQTILTMLLFLLIFYFSYNSNAIITNLINNASSVNDVIIKIYYPIGLYINLIQKFDILELLKLLLVNIIPFVIFIYLTSKIYFKTIAKGEEKSTSSKNKNKYKEKIKKRKKINSLVIKELKRFFSSPVYMFNTLIGIVLLFIATIAMCINVNGAINSFMEVENINMEISVILNILPKVFLGLVIATSSLSSITSSSISIEKKSFNITKSLPLSEKEILLSKLLSSDVILMPVMIISAIIFCIFFKIGIFDIISIFLMILIMPNLVGIIGLLTNLKYPKLNATSDTEIIKQSTSSMIAVLLGMVIAAILVGILIITPKYFSMSINTIILIELIVLSLVTIMLWNILKKYGKKRIKEIDV